MISFDIVIEIFPRRNESRVQIHASLFQLFFNLLFFSLNNPWSILSLSYIRSLVASVACATSWWQCKGNHLSAGCRASRNKRAVLEPEEASDLCIVIPCVFHALHVIMSFTVKKLVIRTSEIYVCRARYTREMFRTQEESEHALTSS